MSEHNAVVGGYNSHTEAEAVVKELQKSEFDMQKPSIVGKDYHTEEPVSGYSNTSDHMQFWGKRGAFRGGLWGLPFGSAGFERGGARMILRHLVRYLGYLGLLGIAMILRHLVRYLSSAAL